MKLPAISALLFFCIACDRPAIPASESLVGARQLPSASELSKETIRFFYGEDQSLSRQLAYDLTPDGHWDLVIYDIKGGRELIRKSFRLEADRVRSIRKKLWRLRPEKLDGLANLHDPSDCPPPPTDTAPEISVGFIDKGPKPDISDDRIGVFTLPHKEICDTPRSTTARQIVDDVVSSLPGANLRAKFDHWPPLG